MAAPVLTRSLLAQPARITARLIARAYLQRVLEEAAQVEVRVVEITEPAATRGAERHRDVVHDLRVALRRLRSWLRVWRHVLGDTVRKSSERRLQRLSKLAGQARDLEVQRAWLNSQRTQRSRLCGESARWMAERVDIEYARALRTLSTTLLKKLGRAAAVLDAELQRQDDERALGAPEPTMASMMGQLLGEHAEELPRVLRRIRRAGQVVEAHAARIAIKRFRYLFDSLGSRSPDVRLVSRYLATLQDRLGALHDAQILAARLTEMSEKASGSRRQRRRASVPRPPDLSALHLLLSRRITSEFLLVRRTIGGPGLARSMSATERVIARLNRLDKLESA
jgi:CHAD domain-containing protein